MTTHSLDISVGPRPWPWSSGIIPGQNSEDLYWTFASLARDILLFLRGGGLRQINEMNPIYHSLHFVLLFPTGQLGWHPLLEYGTTGRGSRTAAAALDDDMDVDLGEEVLHAPGQEPGNAATGHAITSRRRPKYMSQAEYFRFRLFPRVDESDYLFRAGGLFQEFVVDMWAATEQSRLY